MTVACVATLAQEGMQIERVEGGNTAAPLPYAHAVSDSPSGKTAFDRSTLRIRGTVVHAWPTLRHRAALKYHNKRRR